MMMDFLISNAPALIAVLVLISGVILVIHLAEKGNPLPPEHLDQETRHWLKNGQG